ncbi:MAG TPA: hypothetical protein VL359_08895 [bacterium]|nr:hypothetical protein [bacterium]
MPSNSRRPGALRTWVPRVDEGLLLAARLALPVALLLAIASGIALQYVQAPRWPYGDLRGLHVLAGWVIVLAIGYRLLVRAPELAVWALNLVRRQVRLSRLPARNEASLLLLSCLHGLLLLVVLATGAAAEWVRRGGGWAVPGLPAVLAPALHSILAPYYGAALLLHWFFKGRMAWRRLLRELQSP